MLKAEALSFRYATGPAVLENVHFCLQPGEVVGLPGPSGKGKSTLAKLLAGYIEPQRGTLSVDAKPLPNNGYCPVQLLFQHPESAMNPRWRTAKIVGEGYDCSGEILNALGIHHSWLSRYPHELSGGELQRIALARAMGPKTRYIVADEMTAMLDANTQALLWQVMLAWAENNQVGILAISHDPHLLKKVAHRTDTRFNE